MDEVQKRISYWKKIWLELINNFPDKIGGLQLYSPHLLIDDIIVEIEENSFRNKENKAYFLDKINNYYKSDKIIKENFIERFTLLLRTFPNGGSSVILQICKKLKEDFDKGLYFDCCHSKIKSLINSQIVSYNDWFIDLTYYTQGLIVELVKKTYPLEDIKKIIEDIFSELEVSERYGYSTKFPHQIEDEKELKEYFLGLTNNDRIDALNNYYYKKKEKVYFIYQINGLLGKEEFNIGPVRFYMPNIINRDPNEEKPVEIFFRKPNNEGNLQSMCAEIEIDCLSPKSSKKEALSLLDIALDILIISTNSKAKIKADTSNFIILNASKFPISLVSGIRSDERIDFDFRYQLNLRDYKSGPKEFYTKLAWNKSDFRLDKNFQSKLLIAFHWYRKGIVSNKETDKLLNYWIAVESLFNIDKTLPSEILGSDNKNKFDLIQDTIVTSQILNYLYDLSWDTFFHYRNKINFTSLNTEIPDDLLIKAQLKMINKSGERVFLKNFVDNLSEIEKYETDLIDLARIRSLRKFYQESSFRESQIQERLKFIKNEILLIYRLRNLIVHNAQIDNTTTSYYASVIEKFARSLFMKLSNEFSEGMNSTEAIINLKIKREELLFKLKSGVIDLY